MKRNTRREFLRHGLFGAAALWAGLKSPGVVSAVPDAKRTVDRRRLGRINTEVSILGLGLGTGMFWRPEPGSQTQEEFLHRGLDLGINYWDTCRSYPRSEVTIGPVVKQFRDRIFLVSKGNERDYDGFHREIDASLKALQTDHIDLYHLHDLRPTGDADLDEMEKGAVRAARKAKEEGIIRNFGVTGHSGSRILIDAMRRFDPDAVLTIFPCTRPDNGRYEDELLPLAVERNMGMIAMKTVKQAKQAKLQGPELLRYALSLRGVHCVITGMNSMQELEENSTMAMGFQPLTKERRAEIHEHARVALADTVAPWDQPGYRDGVPV